MKTTFFNSYCKAIEETKEELNIKGPEELATEINQFEILPELMEQIGRLIFKGGGRVAIRQLKDIDEINDDEDLRFLIGLAQAFSVSKDTLLEVGLSRSVSKGLTGIRALRFLVTLYGFYWCLSLDDPDVIRIRMENMIPRLGCMKGGSIDA